MSFKQFCFSFRGRINRTAYWFFGILSGILLVGLAAIGDSLMSHGSSVFELVVLLLAMAGTFLIFYMGIPVSVKRLHDVGATGWTLLLLLLPILGAIILVVITGFVKGVLDPTNMDLHLNPLMCPNTNITLNCLW